MWDSLPVVAHPLPLPRAILRVAAEKAGAGMPRLGFFGQGAFTGMRFPTAPLTKKARCLSTAGFLLTRDSVGIREIAMKYKGI